MGKKKKIKIKNKNKFEPEIKPHIEFKPNIEVHCGCNGSDNGSGSDTCECSGATTVGNIIANICPNCSPSSSTLTVNTEEGFIPTSFNPPFCFSTPQGTILLATGTGMATDTETGGTTTGVFSLILQENQIIQEDSATFTYSGINSITGNNQLIFTSNTLVDNQLTISPCTNSSITPSSSNIPPQLTSFIYQSLQAINNHSAKMTTTSSDGQLNEKSLMDNDSIESPIHENADVPSNDASDLVINVNTDFPINIDVDIPVHAQKDVSGDEHTELQTTLDVHEDTPDAENADLIVHDLTEDTASHDFVEEAPVKVLEEEVPTDELGENAPVKESDKEAPANELNWLKLILLVT